MRHREGRTTADHRGGSAPTDDQCCGPVHGQGLPRACNPIDMPIMGSRSTLELQIGLCFTHRANTNESLNLKQVSRIQQTLNTSEHDLTMR